MKASILAGGLLAVRSTPIAASLVVLDSMRIVVDNQEPTISIHLRVTRVSLDQ